MGQLAQRYRDASRSGVYRVTDGAVPRAAALEAGSTISRIDLSNGVEAGALIEEQLAANVQVLIIEGIDAHDFQVFVAALEAAAAARRERGTPFFAVLVDPLRTLPLPTLYREAS